MRGRLDKAVCGARDAAQNRVREHMEFTVWLENNQGRTNPCVSLRPGRDLRIVAHGDGFAVGGFEEDLEWVRN